MRMGWVPAVAVDILDRNELLLVNVVQVPLEALALELLAEDLAVGYVADYWVFLKEMHDIFLNME